MIFRGVWVYNGRVSARGSCCGSLKIVNFAIKNDGFSIKNDELCIENDGFSITNDELCIEK